MTDVLLELPAAVHQAMQEHLLPHDSKNEQAAFVFVRAKTSAGNSIIFRFLDWLPLKADNFAAQHEVYLELRDEMRGSLIKRAHDLNASLVEFHSHPGPYPAQFSPSDLDGFHEFVPHVWWRLRGRPYAAVVVAPSGFDALAWLTSPQVPGALNAISVGGERLTPTGITLRKLHNGPRLYETF
jgi:proteasome lid subunit RPN8/RPN11